MEMETMLNAIRARTDVLKAIQARTDVLKASQDGMDTMLKAIQDGSRVSNTPQLVLTGSTADNHSNCLKCGYSKSCCCVHK